MARISSLALVLLSFMAAAAAKPAPQILEKKFPFPSPVEWQGGGAEISLIGVAWGPADSPAMLAKGHAEYSGGKPASFPNRPYALGLELQATIPGSPAHQVISNSGLVMVKDLNGNLQVPLQLTPSGFVHYQGLPGTFDLHFNRTSTIRFWDFFPAGARQREFLFQVLGGVTTSGPATQPKISFRVLVRGNKLLVVNAQPGALGLCADFKRNFLGTVGATAQASLQLAQQGPKLSGTEQYTRIGKTLYLVGHVDAFGNFFLHEEYPRGHVTGLFKGKFSRGCQTMTGYFSKPDGSRLLPFEFQAEMAEGKTP